MTTRSLIRFAVGTAALSLFVMFALSGSVNSAGPAGKGDKSAPTAPTNLTVTSISETTVTMVWNASTDNSGKFSYRVQINNLNSAYNVLATVSQTQTTYTAKFLSPNSAYSFVVYAVDGSNNRSANSNTAGASTLPDNTGPTAPVLEAVAIAPSQVQLFWSKSTDNVANNCCNYAFKINGSPLTQHINWAYSPDKPDKHSVIIRHLSPATNYNFTVAVSDYSGGNTTNSNTANATTPASNDTTPPTVPTNLRMVNTNGCAEVWLGWNEASDETDPQDKVEYEIYVNGVLSPLPVSAGVDVDFVYGTIHGENEFFIRAVDRTGNSSAPSKPIKLFLWPC
ncbi:MAG: fibronectin type III domain-containing protein [Acidobacteria bacterium]|nr:fibronectin type III domain-containing protein [Acidobacteriota bacterium]